MQSVNQATDVALYLLWLAQQAGDSTLTNLKLLKLLYYAQGFTLAAQNRQLFAEAIETWPHGPVVSRVYETYKKFGNQPIDAQVIQEPESINKADREIVKQVYEAYGTRDAITLRNWTHLELPWVNNEASRTPMSVDLVRSFFSSPRVPSSREIEEQMIVRLSLQYTMRIVGIAEIAKALGASWTAPKVVDMLEKRGVSRPVENIGLSGYKRSDALSRIERLRSKAASFNDDPERIDQEAQASVRLDL